jgi:hypothetical protein
LFRFFFVRVSERAWNLGFFCSFLPLPLPLLRYQLRSLGQLAWVSFVCFLYMWMRHMGIFHLFCLTLLSPQELQGLGVLRKGLFCLFLLSVYWSWGSRATPRFPVQGFFCLDFLLYMWFVESVHSPGPCCSSSAEPRTQDTMTEGYCRNAPVIG